MTRAHHYTGISGGNSEPRVGPLGKSSVALGASSFASARAGD